MESFRSFVSLSFQHVPDDEVEATARIDTPVELDYYRHGGILKFVLRSLAS